MAKQRIRGRPKLADGEAKHATLTLRVRPDERERLKAAARAAGVSLSDWARKALNDAALKK